MKVIETSIDGLLIIEPVVYGDNRGFFLETYNAARYREMGIVAEFVQDNLSRSRRGVLRGLHFQKPMEQGKLVQVLEGVVYDVAVDVRCGSPTFGKWEAVELSENNKRQFYIPPGFAHGFLVLSESALFNYKCTDFYNPQGECSIAWNDPLLSIPWPEDVPELSEKDMKGRNLMAFSDEELPVYE